MSLHTYQTTYSTEDADGTVTSELDVRVIYDFFPAQRAYTPPGEYAPMDPPEPASVELVNIQVERSVGGKMIWRDADAADWEQLSTWIETTLYDTLLDEAANDGPDPDEARERALDRIREDRS